MVNLTLFCALVGKKGSPFPVTIEDSETVSDLKDAIKLEKENALKEIDANKLKMYLAKKQDAWLASSSDEVNDLKRGEKTSRIDALTHGNLKLQGEYGLDEVLNGMAEPKAREIHVLVVVPDLQGVGGKCNYWN
jgi:Crinkler effector protein N-terminal domain